MEESRDITFTNRKYVALAEEHIQRPSRQTPLRDASDDTDYVDYTDDANSTHAFAGRNTGGLAASSLPVQDTMPRTGTTENPFAKQADQSPEQHEPSDLASNHDRSDDSVISIINRHQCNQRNQRNQLQAQVPREGRVNIFPEETAHNRQHRTTAQHASNGVACIIPRNSGCALTLPGKHGATAWIAGTAIDS
jgi:hypothetical protein